MNNKYIMNTYGRKDICFTSGIGSYIFDNTGEKYLDFVMGVAANTFGHCDKDIVDAISNQSSKLIHLSNLYWNEPQMELGHLISEVSGMDSVFFCNSGTESIEAALKIALKNGMEKSEGKNKLICFKNSFHGRTMGSLKVTNEKYQKGFSVDTKNVIVLEFNDLSALEKAFNSDICGVVIEAIQGEGGIVKCNKDFAQKLRSLCDENEAVLIFDEVQCGMGRTGKYFGFEHIGVKADVLALAKGLGGGIPIGATVVNHKYKDVLKPGDHGSTFGGNPLSTACGIEIIKKIERDNILKNVMDMSNYVKEKYKFIKEKYSLGDIKGEGLLLGFDPGITNSKLVDEMFKNKVLVVAAGMNTVRILPPLDVKKDDIDLFFDKLDISMDKLTKC